MQACWKYQVSAAGGGTGTDTSAGIDTADITTYAVPTTHFFTMDIFQSY